jgi:hypothetical protein
MKFVQQSCNLLEGFMGGYMSFTYAEWFLSLYDTLKRSRGEQTSTRERSEFNTQNGS